MPTAEFLVRLLLPLDYYNLYCYYLPGQKVPLALRHPRRSYQNFHHLDQSTCSFAIYGIEAVGKRACERQIRDLEIPMRKDVDAFELSLHLVFLPVYNKTNLFRTNLLRIVKNFTDISQNEGELQIG